MISGLEEAPLRGVEALDEQLDVLAAGPLVRSSYHADQHVPQEEPGSGPLAALP